MEETLAANKLAERIVDQAAADADKTRAQAAEETDAFTAAQHKKLDALKTELATKRETAVKSVLDGARTRAMIDGRKAVLAKKRGVIERAFALAGERMEALPAQESRALIRRVLQAEYEPGETVMPAQADRAAVEEAAKELSIPVSNASAAVSRGFILAGNGYEKDCSFHAVLMQVRDQEESGVAAMLFNN